MKKLQFPLHCSLFRLARFFVKTEDYRDQWMPSLANKTMGDNYLRFYENTLFWVQVRKHIRNIPSHTLKLSPYTYGITLRCEADGV